MYWICNQIKYMQKFKSKVAPSPPDLDQSRVIELKATIETFITVSFSAFAAFREDARATNKRRRVKAEQATQI